jgi:hypothetical protein
MIVRNLINILSNTPTAIISKSVIYTNNPLKNMEKSLLSPHN